MAPINPDLRNPMELVDVADLLKSVWNSRSLPARSTIERARGGPAARPGGASLTHKLIDEYGNFVKIYGAKGLAYIKVTERAKGMDGINSPVAKFLTAEIVEAILDRTPAGWRHDLLRRRQQESSGRRAGALRLKLGKGTESD
ncbi:hypothetical protein LNP74_27525 [Klebsiella pneumoniae subsp. pneumoniae]|nr:hypothetical protein [Klebsiella pneumoniae subsp. pneumoniae]